MSSSKKVTLILTTPGDPLLLLSWYKNFLTYEHLIDECLIFVNYISRYLYHPLSDENLKKLETFYNEKISHPKVKITIDTSYINSHGLATSKFIKTQNCLNEVLLFMEDDNYIYNTDNLKNDLEQVKNETYELIGESRDFCTDHLAEYVKETKNTHVGFWPTNFIVSRKTLLKTDLNFGSRRWEANEKFPGLGDHVFDKPTDGDTMIDLSLQLRQLIPQEKIKEIKMFNLSLITDSNSFGTVDNVAKLDTLYPFIEHNSIHLGSMSSISQAFLWADDLPNKSFEGTDGDLERDNIKNIEVISGSFNIYCRFILVDVIAGLLEEKDIIFKKHYLNNLIHYSHTHLFDSIFFKVPIPITMNRSYTGNTTYYEIFKNIIVRAWLK
tara:strand:- start:4041 stop:5186 length:1146 start_codon:yes stop_codon:yes gene_type:complete